MRSWAFDAPCSGQKLLQIDVLGHKVSMLEWWLPSKGLPFHICDLKQTWKWFHGLIMPLLNVKLWFIGLYRFQVSRIKHCDAKSISVYLQKHLYSCSDDYTWLIPQVGINLLFIFFSFLFNVAIYTPDKLIYTPQNIKKTPFIRLYFIHT